MSVKRAPGDDSLFVEITQFTFSCDLVQADFTYNLQGFYTFYMIVRVPLEQAWRIRVTDLFKSWTDDITETNQAQKDMHDYFHRPYYTIYYCVIYQTDTVMPTSLQIYNEINTKWKKNKSKNHCQNICLICLKPEAIYAVIRVWNIDEPVKICRMREFSFESYHPLNDS